MCGVEFIIELLQIFKHLLHVGGWVHQVGDPEMVGAWSLAKATSWHSHNACLVHHLHAVDEVRRFTLTLSLFYKLLREVESWEAVHGAFNVCAGYIIHRIECG